MNTSFFRKTPICRCAGDPVDVVTGANFFELLDFRLVGPLPLLWIRSYNSQLVNQRLALGWGHTHGFDQTLTSDLDGIRYTNNLRDVVGFPLLESDGDTAAADGLVLERLSERVFALHEQGEPTLEFAFGFGQAVALLTALRRGDDSIRLEYQDGRLCGLVDSLGRYITVKYDQVGRLIGLALSLRGDGEVRPLLQYTYNEQHDIIEAIDPALTRTQYRYDPHHRMVARRDRRGYSFLYEHDDEGRCTRSGGEDGMQDIRLQYHSLEGLTEVTWPNGGKWQYFYDPKAAVTKVVDPYGGLYAFDYDELGRLVQEVDPNKNVHPISYDDTGAPLESPIFSSRLVGPPPFYEPPPEDADHWVADNPLEFEYGDLLSPEALAEPPYRELLGSDVPSDVRASIRKSPVTAPNDSTDIPGCFQPEPAGRDPQDCLAGKCECEDFGLTFDRSQFGLVHLENFPDGTSRRWKYDSNGSIRSYTDREGRQYAYQYASWNKLVQFTDPLGCAVDYQYSQTEELTRVKDSGGRVSEYSYDLKDRLTHVHRGGTLKEEYRYDAADNLVAKLDGQGKPLLAIEIGPNNREAAVNLASGDRHEFSYDEAGHIVRAATKECEVLCEYDPSGRLTSDLQNGLGVRRERADDGREILTVLGKFSFRYEFLDDYTLRITDPGRRSHLVQSLPGGLFHRRMGNGTEELAQFDQTGRCLFKATWRDEWSSRKWVRQYDYSPEGDLIRIRDNQRGQEAYDYDAAHRLIGTTSNGQKQQFRYDTAGNLLSHWELNGAFVADGNRLSAADSETFEYNERHHICGRQGPESRIDYKYDSLDMLQRVRSPAGETSFSYDPLARRTSKSHNGRTTRFYWDGDRLAAEIYPEDRIRIYVYPDDLALVPLLFLEYKNLQADPQSAKRYYLFANQIGIPIRVEDEQGNAVSSARISPYGSIKVDDKTDFSLPLRFPGHYFDEETGLHYNRFRYYDPQLGRYLESDPDGIGGGLNLYAYPSQPLTQVDVQGLKKAACCPGGKKSGKPCKPKRKESTGKKGKKDPYRRPSGFRKGVREKVWNKAKGPDGKVRDPQTKKVIRPGQPWDMGHKGGYEFRKHQASARERQISRKEFLDEHNKPVHYRPELPSSNRNHKGEDKTGRYRGD